MYKLSPISPRISKLRDKYRSTKPKICIARYKIVTEFYQENPQITGILKRAKNFKNLCEKLPIYIDQDDVIVGFQATSYRASALYPEFSFGWFMDELKAGILPTRESDPYDIDDEDAAYVLATGDYWRKECVSAKVEAYIPPGYFKCEGNGVSTYRTKNVCERPVGHFAADFNKAIRKGFKAIKQEAQAKMDELEGRMFGDSVYQYNFYRAITIVSDGMILWPNATPGPVRNWPPKKPIRIANKNLRPWPTPWTGSWKSPVGPFTMRFNVFIYTNSVWPWTANCMVSATAVWISTWVISTRPIWPLAAPLLSSLRS